MANEYRTYGPPGTGKTTWLAAQVRAALLKYDPNGVYVCSFTRAAAVEVAGRDLRGLPKRNVGTIHSLCYRCSGRPIIIETDAEVLGEWNHTYPRWPVRGESSAESPIFTPGDTDALLAWNRERSMLTGRVLPVPFAPLWEEFKQGHDVVDFTDLLLQAPEHLPEAQVLMVDEAQDLTPLQWRIVRKWGETVEVLVVVGDDDQLLYGFLGANSATFLSPLAEDHKRFLKQSYRLPRRVFETAQAWIHRLPVGSREEKNYGPRDEDGIVETHATYRTRDPAAVLADVMATIKQGDSAMLLASCGYMLAPVVKALRTAGVPFHNPYRVSRGDWNPLKRTAKRIAAFVTCHKRLHRWSERGTVLPIGAVWAEWIDMVSSEVLQRGAKAEARRWEGEVSEDVMTGWLSQESFDALVEGDLDWLFDHLTARFRKVADYPVRVYRTCGEAGLKEPPQVIVGTIHSVKGGEADTVYLFPDLSYRTMTEMQRNGRAQKDALIRQFYVGMTRARKRLCLCGPSSKYHVAW